MWHCIGLCQHDFQTHLEQKITDILGMEPNEALENQQY